MRTDLAARHHYHFISQGLRSENQIEFSKNNTWGDFALKTCKNPTYKYTPVCARWSIICEAE